jgi:hypothetical protein
MCDCHIDRDNFDKETKDGNIHMNDYVKDLGFCGCNCFYKLNSQNRRKIELNNLFRKLSK